MPLPSPWTKVFPSPVAPTAVGPDKDFGGGKMAPLFTKMCAPSPKVNMKTFSPTPGTLLHF